MNQKRWRYLKMLLIQACLLLSAQLYAQCPPNIGFESGTFDNWETSVGSITRSDGSLVLSPGLSPGRQTILRNTYPQIKDPYGDFPVNCPNGSGYSIQLGNSGTGAQAERVSYTFTIPTGQNNYSIIYNYAVVFQNPSHQTWEQPKFTANVFDVTNNTYIGCSSFSYTASANLPGFFESKFKDSVFCKPWTPVTIKLSGMEGRTIRLEFTTNDCSRGGHFGYAYVDVNENCSSPISGYVQCAFDTLQTLTAPFGFASYKWFNKDFSKLLGTDINLPLNPIPPANTIYGVEVTPFPEQGCIDTVYATIQVVDDTLNLKVPTAPLVACQNSGVDLTAAKVTAGTTPGLVFSYYLDPSQINYLPTPKNITSSGVYYIKANNALGCTSIKPVVVNIAVNPDFSLQDSIIIRPAFIDANKLVKGNVTGTTFTYWTNAATTIPLINPKTINKTGTYYAKGTNSSGCTYVVGFSIKVIDPPIIPPNAFSPNADGVHDTWEIPILSVYPECTVEIFNRLGQLLYRTIGYNTPWDGRYNGIDQPVATYYYVIKAGPGYQPFGGSVTIVR